MDKVLNTNVAQYASLSQFSRYCLNKNLPGKIHKDWVSIKTDDLITLTENLEI